METKDTILKLRKSLGLSQEEFAQKLFVTRQAVSRWEKGETVPNTDTLKCMAETFGVTVDMLLGAPAAVCQSCGMVMAQENQHGTCRDGSLSQEYCGFCYQQGTFTKPLTMEELIAHNLQHLEEWNKSEGTQLTAHEAEMQLMQYLPTLKRWQK